MGEGFLGDYVWGGSSFLGLYVVFGLYCLFFQVLFYWVVDFIDNYRVVLFDGDFSEQEYFLFQFLL